MVYSATENCISFSWCYFIFPLADKKRLNRNYCLYDDPVLEPKFSLCLLKAQFCNPEDLKKSLLFFLTIHISHRNKIFLASSYVNFTVKQVPFQGKSVVLINTMDLEHVLSPHLVHSYVSFQLGYILYFTTLFTKQHLREATVFWLPFLIYFDSSSLSSFSSLCEFSSSFSLAPRQKAA